MHVPVCFMRRALWEPRLSGRKKEKQERGWKLSTDANAIKQDGLLSTAVSISTSPHVRLQRPLTRNKHPPDTHARAPPKTFSLLTSSLLRAFGCILRMAFKNDAVLPNNIYTSLIYDIYTALSLKGHMK